MTTPDIVPSTDMDQLKLLMDYTKFHIGIYATVMTVLLGLVAIGTDQTNVKIPEHYRRPLLTVAAMLALAGCFAGIVAAAIPNNTVFDDYWTGPIRILGKELSFMSVKTAATLEHFFFWLAVVIGWISVAKKGFPPKEKGCGGTTL